MKILIEGHQEQAICPKCDDVRTVTFRYKPYFMEHGEAIPEVLQGFCNHCGEGFLIPPQSIPKIKPFYQNLNVTQEYKVPSVVDDILLNIGALVKMEKPETFKSVLRFYLEKSKHKNWLKNPSTEFGPLATRLSFRVDAPTDILLKHTVKKFDLNKNRFITLMFWDAKDRLLGETQDAREFFSSTKLLHALESETV